MQCIFFIFAGADVVIFERLKAGQEDLKARTQDHLDVRQTFPFFLNDFVMKSKQEKKSCRRENIKSWVICALEPVNFWLKLGQFPLRTKKYEEREEM